MTPGPNAKDREASRRMGGKREGWNLEKGLQRNQIQGSDEKRNVQEIENEQPKKKGSRGNGNNH